MNAARHRAARRRRRPPPGRSAARTRVLLWAMLALTGARAGDGLQRERGHRQGLAPATSSSTSKRQVVAFVLGIGRARLRAQDGLPPARAAGLSAAAARPARPRAGARPRARHERRRRPPLDPHPGRLVPARRAGQARLRRVPRPLALEEAREGADLLHRLPPPLRGRRAADPAADAGARLRQLGGPGAAAVRPALRRRARASRWLVGLGARWPAGRLPGHRRARPTG